jgi:hypothetical protein
VCSLKKNWTIHDKDSLHIFVQLRDDECQYLFFQQHSAATTLTERNSKDTFRALFADRITCSNLWPAQSWFQPLLLYLWGSVKQNIYRSSSHII